MLSIVVYFIISIQPLSAETTKEPSFLHLFTSSNPTADDVARFEFSSGGDIDPKYWSTYSSVTWALGKPVDTDGFRIRLSGGASQYSFNVLLEDARGGATPIIGVGRTGFGDILAGYRAHWGDLWVTALGGGVYDGRILLPGYEAPQAFAPKAALEAWLNATDRAWISAQAYYSWSRQTFSGSLRLGLRAFDILDLGPEASAVGDLESARARAGGFLRLTYHSVEVTAAGGVESELDGASACYGSLGLFRRF